MIFNLFQKKEPKDTEEPKYLYQYSEIIAAELNHISGNYVPIR